MLSDYTNLTEITGSKISREQLQRMYNRYYFAAELSKDKDVLEVACGVGQGLGLLAKKARRVVAGDYTENLVVIAQKHYGDRVRILKIDAHNLPFEDKSFDLVILYEAIYYLQNPEKFVQEARRILREGGCILICTANKDWEGFNPSPHSYRYFSVPELSSLLKKYGFKVEMRGDCLTSKGSLISKVISMAKKMAIGLHLIPKTMKSREWLKRIFFGRLEPMKAELQEGDALYCEPTIISDNLPNRDYKVIFAIGKYQD